MPMVMSSSRWHRETASAPACRAVAATSATVLPPPNQEKCIDATSAISAIPCAPRRETTGAMLPGKKSTGRPRVIGPAELATFRRLVNEGVSITEAARTLKIGRSTAYAALAGR
ncbi:helix-turn-helix domain-containing protein [Nonomuraea sp. NPDC049655]|uniref:helix-turn-helix domain-containing protein n=1 Tax=Nonomuraea sp. NPDC049655 TaxID=3364355 RepID=UPI0037A7C0A0